MAGCVGLSWVSWQAASQFFGEVAEQACLRAVTSGGGSVFITCNPGAP
jgi:hypothetical protein